MVNTIAQIVCTNSAVVCNEIWGMLISIFFDQFQFAQFHWVLDGELKQLNSTGNYIHKKKANVITVEMEEILLEKGLLGDCSCQVVSDTILYLLWGVVKNIGDCATTFTASARGISSRHTIPFLQVEYTPRWIEAEDAYPQWSCASCQWY